MGRDHAEIKCPDCEGRGHTEDTRFAAPYGDTIAHGGDAPRKCETCHGTGIKPPPECGNCGAPGAPVATFGGDVFCSACMHAILVEEMESAANTVQRSDAVMIGDLVRSLHSSCRRCKTSHAKGWRDGITHALGIVLDEYARLACAWREAVRLGPATPDTNFLRRETP